jgi:hypothetical protein
MRKQELGDLPLPSPNLFSRVKLLTKPNMYVWSTLITQKLTTNHQSGAKKLIRHLLAYIYSTHYIFFSYLDVV